LEGEGIGVGKGEAKDDGRILRTATITTSAWGNREEEVGHQLDYRSA